jgi:hypothetical protein
VALTRAWAQETADRVELARYTVRSGQRVVIAQRINGIVRVSDRPASGEGRSYLVARGVERDGNAALQALIADYLGQCAVHDCVPMETSVLRSYLEWCAATENKGNLVPRPGSIALES